MPNTHETVELRRVGVGGVYMNSQLAHDIIIIIIIIRISIIEGFMSTYKKTRTADITVKNSRKNSANKNVFKSFLKRVWVCAWRGSIPKRPMNQNGPREGQKRPITRCKTAHVDVQNGPQLYPKWPTRMSKTAHRPKRHRRKRTINFRYIQNGLLTAK